MAADTQLSDQLIEFLKHVGRKIDVEARQRLLHCPLIGKKVGYVATAVGHICNFIRCRTVACSIPHSHEVFMLIVTTKPQQLTSQSSLEPFRLLLKQLVCSRRHARQPTRCEEGTRSVRHVFVGGRCGGAAPAQGRPLAADRPKYNNEGRKNTFARLVQGCVSVAAE